MDATYRADLRELNELNFARFDAKVGERLAELRAEMDSRFAAAEARLTERLAKLRDELSDRIRDTRISILWWMFSFWVGTIVPLAGLMLALWKL